MIPEKVEESIQIVFTYASHIDEWIVVKKEVLKNIHPSLRALFSIRDPKTKKQVPNAFDLEVAARWSQLTGRKVIFKQDGQKNKKDPSGVR